MVRRTHLCYRSSLHTFRSQENVSTLTFSPSETALLYSAEANAPNNTSDDPYAKYRYKPTLGEGFSGKKQPHFFLLRWNPSSQPDPSNLVPRLYEIRPEHDSILFGQGVFSSSPEETTIYATGYEYTPDGKLLGLKGCFNRPFGIWELHFETQLNGHGDDNDEKKRDLIIHLAHKISDANSSRSPRVVEEDSKSVLYWLSSDAGGPHISTASLHSLDITTSNTTSSEVSSVARIVLPIPETVGTGFPGLYPPFNLPTRCFMQSEANPLELVVQSQWGSRTTIISINCSTGAVKDLTPSDPGKSNFNRPPSSPSLNYG